MFNMVTFSSYSNAYKCKVKKRVFKISAPSTSINVKKEDQIDGPKIEGPPKPLRHMEFVIIGKTAKPKEDLKREILLMGGSVSTKITKDTAAVIACPQDVEKMGAKMEQAQENDIDVVTEDFVDEAKDYLNSIPILIKKKAISSWGGDPSKRIKKSVAEKSAKSKSKSSYEKSVSGPVKLRIKGGGAVDPDSGLEDEAHVYQRGDEKFTATLSLTDVQSGKNSYYRLQILKHDKMERYWLFRSWGRIGTSIGNTKCDKMSCEEAVQLFEDTYLKQTGNEWYRRKNFKKIPGKYQPLEIEHDADVVDGKLLESEIPSKLKKPVQDLMQLIFDVQKMKKAMLEYEIDVEKMPLGKISKKQIREAYSTLTQLSEILKTGNPERTELISATNKFYTLVPHNFGVKGPSIIDTQDEIRTKSEMLEALLDMEIAYSLLHGKTDGTKNPIDVHYDKLKNDIGVLDKNSEEYKIIEKYVKNTHAETHSQYELEIQEVFTLRRSGENSKYNKNAKQLPNKKLLWHGSRTTNYAGILSHGLRIAPPEAPVSGYMFGKGVYFADMVSKSANYCCTNSENPTGLLLLCEVALGEMDEKLHADYVEKLPKGKNSVWGKGKTMPDPEKSVITKHGVEIPCGPAMKVDLPQKSSLLYNEFIVYDVDQVKMEYLVKTNFKYKY